MPAPVDFSGYLQFLVEAYNPQPDCYTLTDLQVEIRIENPASPGQPEARKPDTQEPDAKKAVKIERSPVLTGLCKYVQQGHVLLVGKPGSGKSTALQRLCWEMAATDVHTDETDGEITSVSSIAKSGVVPVLVELRSYADSIEHLIQKFLRRHRLRLSLEAIDDLLFEGRLLLLLDGVNELPTGALGTVETFRKNNSRCPMIFTTRVLDAGAGLGISQKLELCALTEPQMREFIQKRLSGQADILLRQLKDRLRELAETPLLLKILCDVFQVDRQIPKSRGELFHKQFAQQYAEFKRLPELVGDSSGLLPQLLQTLAFEMMQGNDPTKPIQFVLQLSKAAAAEKLQQWLQTDREKAEHYLQALLKHHLLQQAADPNQIEFCHQLFQEYYAAEHLLRLLNSLSDAQLQQDYLNLLKWTEPLAMMAALIPDQQQAVRLVKLALEVDWNLGARLAGEVQPQFQEKTVAMVSALEVPVWLKVELWGETRSQCAISSLLPLLQDSNRFVRASAAEALGRIVSGSAIPGLLPLLQDSDDLVRRSAAVALGKIGFVEAIPGLLRWLQDYDDLVRRSAAAPLRQRLSVEAIPRLLRWLQDSAFDLRWRAAAALKYFKDDSAAYILPDLLTLIPTESGKQAFQALTAIQVNCQFYNYEIFQAREKQGRSQKAEARSPEQTKYVSIEIKRVGNLNTGNVTIHGDQIVDNSNLENLYESD